MLEFAASELAASELAKPVTRRKAKREGKD
jgi:hypothetical protein